MQTVSSQGLLLIQHCAEVEEFMIAVAHGAGKKLVLKPAFTERDEHVNRNQTALSASVATDRGGNERAINVAKQSWYVKRGFWPNSDPKQMNNA